MRFVTTLNKACPVEFFCYYCSIILATASEYCINKAEIIYVKNKLALPFKYNLANPNFRKIQASRVKEYKP